MSGHTTPSRTRAPFAAALLAVLGFGVDPTAATAQNTYNVSQRYGYSTTDNTAFLQAALDDPTAAVIVVDDLQGTLWRTDGLVLTRSDVRIEFAPTVTLEAIPFALGQFESLLNIRAASNVFVEGNGATFRIDKSNYPQNSEFRHCIISRGSVGCTVQNLTLTGAAGDGIEVAPNFVPDVNDFDGDGDTAEFLPLDPTLNLTLDNLVCDANNRQGMSVISVVGLTVNNCTFSNTQGTLPESGVDFEPFQRYMPMQGIVMTGCTFSGNHGNGIQFAGVDIDDSTPPTDILIDNALVENNGLNPNSNRAGVDINNTYDPFAGSDQTQDPDGYTSSTGTFTMTNSTIRDEAYPGINVRQYATGLDVAFTNVDVVNCANNFFNANLGPVIVQPPFYGAELTDEPCFGNAAFTNVTLVDDQTNRAHVTVSDLRSGPTGPALVTGNIDVQLVGAAAGTQPIYVEDPDDCGGFTLTVTSAVPLPIELAGFDVRGRDCAHEVAWRVAGASLLEGFAVEASRDAVTWREAFAKTSSDAEGLGEHRAELPGGEGRFYRLRSDFADGTAEYSAIVYAEGCSPGGDGDGLRVWPNPSRGRLHVSPRATARVLELFDAQGRRAGRYAVAAGQTRIDLGAPAAGVYQLVDAGAGGAAARVVLRGRD